MGVRVKESPSFLITRGRSAIRMAFEPPHFLSLSMSPEATYFESFKSLDYILGECGSGGDEPHLLIHYLRSCCYSNGLL